VANLTDHGLPLFHWGVVIGASLAAAVCDLHKRRIPNILTVPVFVAGIVWAAWTAGLRGAAESVLACVILAAPYLVLFLFFGGGAGDAKLMGAIGGWLGIVNGLAVLFCVALTGAAIGTAMVLMSKTALSPKALSGTTPRASSETAQATFKTAARAASRKMPYGVAIFVGVCLAALGALLCWP
jgi:Flp pilus assembly protein protease CpaA